MSDVAPTNAEVATPPDAAQDVTLDTVVGDNVVDAAAPDVDSDNDAVAVSAAAPPPAAPAKPPSLWPDSLLGGLQKLSTQQTLYGIVERHMGHARMENGKVVDNWLAVARMIMHHFEASLRIVRGVIEDAAEGADGDAKRIHSLNQGELAACVFVDMREYDADAPTCAADVMAIYMRLHHRIFEGRQSASTTTAACDDDDDAIDSSDDWSFPPQLIADACTAVYEALSVNLRDAVATGAEQLRVDAQIEEEKTAEAQRAAAAADSSRTRKALALNSEDKYVLSVLGRAGLNDIVDAERMPADEDAEEETTFEIEVAVEEPRFLKGKIPKRRRTNYFAEGRRAQNEALREQAVGSKMKDKLRDVMRSFNEEPREELTSMEAAAQRQGDLAKERREIRARKRRLQAADGAAGRGGGAEERTTRDAVGFTNAELDERVEEQGIRGKADLPPGALPPWLGGSGGGDASERAEITWGVNAAAQTTLQQQRARLPIALHKQRIIDTIASQTITVLVGETGSGKTTQLAQYLFEAGYGGKGLIGCTQPRRVAAVSLADRVAVEFGCRVGEEVGYNVRFVDQTSKLTKIKYLTDGMLLREALGDDTFSAYSVIILDEAHERSLNTDILFALVKKAAEARNGDLKVVVTSATLDIDKFCAYFNTPEPLMIPGRTHPVEKEFSEGVVEDYVEETMHAVMNIHLQAPPGDILCFLTGQDEIEAVAERLHQWTTSEDLDMPPLIITVIFGALPQENQSLVFDKTPRGSRKVVLATNIAETSITIDDLFYVVDCGFCKQNIFDPKTGVEALKIVPISRQQAEQRAGRAGRTGPGKCLRLYTEGQFLELPQASVPEIKRTNLINVVLTLKATGVADLLTFDFLDPPDTDTLVSALERLFYLGALDQDGVLTKLGSRMSELPLDPTQCRTLLTALDLGCASTVLTVVAMLSTQNPFYRPKDRHQEADLRKATFVAPQGDQLTLLNVYDAWIAEGATAEWCQRNYIQHRSLRDARDIRTQLERILSRRAAASAAVGNGNSKRRRQPNQGQDQRQPGSEEYDHAAAAAAVECLGPEQGNRDPDLIRKALTAGYFFQAAKLLNDDYRTLVDRRKVAVHPSSALAHSRPRYVIYHELVMTSKEYMRSAMAIDPQWLVELAPDFYSRPAPGQLTREQRAERIAPKLRRMEAGNDWRISKVRLKMRR